MELRYIWRAVETVFYMSQYKHTIDVLYELHAFRSEETQAIWVCDNDVLLKG